MELLTKRKVTDQNKSAKLSPKKKNNNNNNNPYARWTHLEKLHLNEINIISSNKKKKWNE